MRSTTNTSPVREKTSSGSPVTQTSARTAGNSVSRRRSRDGVFHSDECIPPERLRTESEQCGQSEGLRWGRRGSVAALIYLVNLVWFITPLGYTTGAAEILMKFTHQFGLHVRDGPVTPSVGEQRPLSICQRR